MEEGHTVRMEESVTTLNRRVNNDVYPRQLRQCRVLLECYKQEKLYAAPTRGC